jgi:chromatin remodeling complex protein RSC6
MSTAATSHTLSKDLAPLLGNRRVATRTEILGGLLRYATKRNLIAEDRMLHPDAFLTELLGTSDPLHVKDLFLNLRPHVRPERSASR